MTEFKCGQYWIETCQGYVRFACKSSKCIQSWLRMSQRVEFESVCTFVTFALETVWFCYTVSIHQQELNDFSSVIGGCKYKRCYVGWELCIVGARRLPKRVLILIQIFFVEYFVFRMSKNCFGYLRVTHENRKQKSFLYLLTVAFWKQSLHYLNNKRCLKNTAGKRLALIFQKNWIRNKNTILLPNARFPLLTVKHSDQDCPLRRC